MNVVEIARKFFCGYCLIKPDSSVVRYTIFKKVLRTCTFFLARNALHSEFLYLLGYSYGNAVQLVIMDSILVSQQRSTNMTLRRLLLFFKT